MEGAAVKPMLAKTRKCPRFHVSKNAVHFTEDELEILILVLERVHKENQVL